VLDWLYNHIIYILGDKDIIKFYGDIASDSFTVLVGFVAIGIPLSIQIAESVSKRYDNNLLAKVLTSGRYITPPRIIGLSFFYIFIVMLTKINLQDVSFSIENESDKRIFIFVFLFEFITFAILIFSAGWLFVSLYSKVIQQKEDFVTQFLELDDDKKSWELDEEKKQLDSSIIDDFKRYYISFLMRRRTKRFNKSKLVMVNAGLELLLKHLEDKGWEQLYTEQLISYNNKIDELYFSKYCDSHLIDSDLVVVKGYWGFLVRLVRISRESKVAKLCFHSQRLLGQLLSNIVNHEQYDFIVEQERKILRDSRIDWHSDMYEIARWQSNLNENGIDLVLSGEWISDIFGIMVNQSSKTNTNGTIQSLNLWLELGKISAERCPEKIIELYKNLSQSINYMNGKNYIYRYGEKNQEWLIDFWSSFNKIPARLSNIKDFVKIIEDIKSGQIYYDYRSSASQQPLTEEQREEALSVIDFKELYQKAIYNEAKVIGWRFCAYLAFHERWNELRDCLDWKNPKGARSINIGESILPENMVELCTQISKEYNSAANHSFFIEHHDVLIYSLRSWLFQMVYFFEQSENTINISFNSLGSLSSIQLHKQILNGLINQVPEIQNSNCVEFSSLFGIRLELERLLIHLDNFDIEFISKQKISTQKWLSFRREVESGWENKFNLADVFNVEYRNALLSREARLTKDKSEKRYFIENGDTISRNEIFGEVASKYLINHIYGALLDIATTTDALELNSKVIFSSRKRLVEFGFTASSKNENNMYYDKMLDSTGIVSNSNKTLIVERKNFKLLLTKNVSV